MRAQTFARLRCMESDVGLNKAPLPEYSDDGVDLSLIRWMLSLSPDERLDVLEGHLNDILAIRAFIASNPI